MGKIGINISTGSLQKEDIIVGIDLGTTNSLVAFVHPETRRPQVIKEVDNSTLVPSVIYFDEGGGVIVGSEAKSKLETDAKNTIFSAKRLMGKSYKDIADRASFFGYKIIDDGSESLVRVEAKGKFYNPIELSAYILKELKKRAEHILKAPISKAVITVPAYFNDTQRQATRDAGKLAGLEVLRIINEPTAASLAYGLGLNKEESKVIAVYDLGGGTFDVSILKITNGIFDVLATNGDTFLGGDDFDKAIVDYWEGEIGKKFFEQEGVFERVRGMAERAKKKLGEEDFWVEEIEGKKFELSREKFEELVTPLVDRTMVCFRQALQDAGLGVADLDLVLMVGGSTRSRFVKQKVGEMTSKPINDFLDPDEVVALGAAVQADILAGNNKDFLLLDVCPLSLGVETMGGLMDVLITRNSKIPTRAGRQYTTHKDGQSGMIVGVFQGERDLVKDNRKLGEFILKGIPNMPAGMPKVDISFNINVDGILSVKAKELRSGVEQSIEIKPQYGITDEDVERMLMASLAHSEEDIAMRALIEAINEGEAMVENTKKFIAKNREMIFEEELKNSEALIQELEKAMREKNKDAVLQFTQTLNEVTRPFSERIMDETIKRVMQGKKI